MCYAIPAQVVALEGQVGVVDYFGEKRKILLDPEIVEICPGDYVYAQGGVLIRKIPADEAQEILAKWREIFFTLKQIDAALATLDKRQVSPNALAVLQKVNVRKSLTPGEMLALFALQDIQELKVLYAIANNVRQREHGNASCVHGIIEFSNHCCSDCHYCGIRHTATDIERYRMSIEEIIAVAHEAVTKHGFKALVLQSGEDLWYDTQKLVQIVRAIKKMGVLIFVSLGSRSLATYQELYAAGARAVLLRFETANEQLFAKLRPNTNLAERLQLIKDLKVMGYVLATGFLLGLPNETPQDIVNNILLTKYLAPDMYSFGPLIPTHNTPLADVSQVTKDRVLQTIAITRFVASNANILVTTALETLNPLAKKEALLAGANSLMVNLTPRHYRRQYKIYDNKAESSQELPQAVQGTINLLYELGRAPTDIGVERS